MKRTSNTELNHDNWNDDDVPEDRGTFAAAPVDVISKRKVISAKRKPTVSQTGVFKSFGGFSSNPISSSNVCDADNTEIHLHNLKILNKKFLENIEKCINENNFCILSPLFDDYQRHLTTIKTKYPLTNSNVTDSSPSIVFKSSAITEANNNTTKEQNQLGMFNFNQTRPSLLGKSDDAQKPFSFHNKQEESSTNLEKPSFTFPSNATKTQESSLFGHSNFLSKPQVSSTPFNLFGATKINESNPSVVPTLFGSSVFPTTPETENANNDEEEYVPPSAEIREIKESDSVFDIRCRLFYQTNQNWKEKGVGNIFVKPMSPGKFQLVMRADNNLGTILLNVLITKAMPITVIKNNVSVVAMTDFSSPETKPTPLLIRVKTAESAEELMKAMKEQLN